MVTGEGCFSLEAVAAKSRATVMDADWGTCTADREGLWPDGLNGSVSRLKASRREG